MKEAILIILITQIASNTMAATGEGILKVCGGQDETGAVLVSARPQAKMSWEHLNAHDSNDTFGGLNQDC